MQIQVTQLLHIKYSIVYQSIIVSIHIILVIIHYSLTEKNEKEQSILYNPINQYDSDRNLIYDYEYYLINLYK